MNSLFLPRGIRNNNPGNIRLSKTAWHGQKPVQADPDFAEFTAALYGLRALMKTLLTYHLKYGLDTVESVINRYAPPHENATDRYIHHVARALKVGRTETIDITSPGLLTLLARAIVLHENGRPPPARPVRLVRRGALCRSRPACFLLHSSTALKGKFYAGCF